MGLHIITIVAVLSVLASTSAAVAAGDACAETMGCCPSPAPSPSDQHTRACDRDPGQLERTCCCTVEPAPAILPAPVPAMVEHGARALVAIEPALAAHPAAATEPAAVDLDRLMAPDRGPPPTSDSLLAQHIALLL